MQLVFALLAQLVGRSLAQTGTCYTDIGYFRKVHSTALTGTVSLNAFAQTWTDSVASTPTLVSDNVIDATLTTTANKVLVGGTDYFWTDAAGAPAVIAAELTMYYTNPTAFTGNINGVTLAITDAQGVAATTTAAYVFQVLFDDQLAAEGTNTGGATYSAITLTAGACVKITVRFISPVQADFRGVAVTNLAIRNAADLVTPRTFPVCTTTASANQGEAAKTTLQARYSLDAVVVPAVGDTRSLTADERRCLADGWSTYFRANLVAAPLAAAVETDLVESSTAGVATTGTDRHLIVTRLVKTAAGALPTDADINTALGLGAVTGTTIDFAGPCGTNFRVSNWQFLGFNQFDFTA